MEGERAEFNDWEVLQDSDAIIVLNSSESTERSFEGIDGDSEGIIRSDYFSLHNRGRLVADETEDDSAESDNPSWIDPAVPETRMMNPAEFWSDSASDRSEDRKSITEFDPKRELGFMESSAKKVQLEESGGIQALNETDSLELWSETGGEEMELAAAESGGEELERLAAKTNGSEAEGERKIVAWWKVPIEILKFCAFRVSPVWTLSVAAAMLGVVILGRRLYRMKHKTQTLQLKVTMDDKKVSQFMTRAAKLNEAFSVVKRVPVVRPSLPAPGSVTPWPVMSLR